METSTLTMYSMKKVYDLPDKISLPLTMYSMKNLHSQIATKPRTNPFKSLEERQEQILVKLQELESKLKSMRNTKKTISQQGILKDIVIKANPLNPPLAVLKYIQWLKNHLNIGIESFSHSSLSSSIDDSLKNLFSSNSNSRTRSEVFVTLIWHGNPRLDPIMILDPMRHVAIEGEVNILRYLSNLIETETDEIHSTDVDAILDLVHGSVIHGSNKERQSALKVFNSRLGKFSWLNGNSFSVADIAAWAAIKNNDLLNEAPPNVKRWALQVENLN